MFATNLFETILHVKIKGITYLQILEDNNLRLIQDISITAEELFLTLSFYSET